MYSKDHYEQVDKLARARYIILNREYSLATYAGSPKTQVTQDMVDQMSGWRAYLDALVDYEQEIRKKYNTGKYIRKKLAKEYNVDVSTIYKIINNKVWVINK